MIRLSRPALAIAAAVALATGGYAYAQSAAVGIAASVIKEVKLSNAQAPKARPVTVKQRIALGDLIQTGKASQLQIKPGEGLLVSDLEKSRLFYTEVIGAEARCEALGEVPARSEEHSLNSSH